MREYLTHARTQAFTWKTRRMNWICVTPFNTIQLKKERKREQKVNKVCNTLTRTNVYRLNITLYIILYRRQNISNFIQFSLPYFWFCSALGTIILSTIDYISALFWIWFHRIDMCTDVHVIEFQSKRIHFFHTIDDLFSNTVFLKIRIVDGIDENNEQDIEIQSYSHGTFLSTVK